MLATYQCAVCGEIIETNIDESQGAHQSYIEDCEVCCRPNKLDITITGEGSAVVQSTFEE
jgi:hypothetical protein